MAGRRNGTFGAVLAIAVVTMAGASFAAVPLYRVFCQATGYNGTPKIGSATPPGVATGQIEIRFDANTNSGLPWMFAPERAAATVALGEEAMASYTAENRANRAVTGVATYNVMPDKAAQYFHKTACFCFNEQTLGAGQRMSFPVSFWVDPTISTDPETRDVHTITLSYTFFRSLDDAARNGGFERAGPHVGSRSEASKR